MDLTAIRSAIADELGAVAGLRCYSEWPDKPEVPSACIRPDDPYLEPWQSFGNTLMQANFVLDVLVAAMPDGARAQKRLDALIGEEVVDALMADRQLGGLAEDVVWTSTSGLREITVSQVSYVGHAIAFEVRARHS